MDKLKVRLDAFSDAIIAIIITIMVLDLHGVVTDSPSAYLSLAKEIGIYFISFFYVANMWYSHATAFDEINSMTYRILIMDFVFLAALSLMPLFTSMMATNTTRVTVMAYGLLSAVVSVLFRFLTQSIIHFEYTNKSDMAQVYIKIFGFNNRIQMAISIAAIILAYFKPTWAIIFFLAYPIWNFLSSSSDRQEMYDVEQLTPDQRKDFLDFSTADRKAFREQQEKITAMLKTNAENPVAVDNADVALQTPVDDADADSLIDQPVSTQAPVRTPAATSAQAKATNVKPSPSPRAPKTPRSNSRRRNYWQQWLDQSDDPQLQDQLRQGGRLTQIQKQQWESWFKEQRQKDPRLQRQTQQARKQAQKQAQRQARKQK
ncbi:TMEM175 family protein [Furfurilactobacillus milii]|uniref:TMEM175 family protein n=2 Tax=Furfurilactobacillus TaxID=2767882 RepID=A0ABT6DCA3_9LACO|nr:TMEM175 family protein [Furfurilactobacillus milii]QLE65555.1 integral membrane protein [Furfurilactobacillus rossiae]MCF6161175.1 TMEM175 family protein [Furfurilactobacillus milii]MCF6163570.1 TMEM175 family protein [Furfurilactobacillus milii]MDF9913857.1 TMEM175 family protein [Furfurilactobacillus milii]QLE67985.1 putative integral membrane protein [Furfurilactobacillus rossiae]